MKNHVVLLGAGPVGSLMSCYLREKGYQVDIYEKRPDMRKNQIGGGRSINLALSDRGWKALYEVGIGEKVKELGIPMSGRMMHDLDGNLSFQAYGENGESIYSVSRSKLNEFLMTAAEEKGAQIVFDAECRNVDFENTSIDIEVDGENKTISADYLIGADGAFSSMRKSMDGQPGFTQKNTVLDHGYKELTIPAKDGEFALDPNCLHIWPRNSFMLIALPNLDKSFTCTLFFSMKGELSFESLREDQEIINFFNEYFADAVPLMPDLLEEYKTNPTSGLITIQCYPWSVHQSVMIGDASHAIVPFYGQGMNSGFEDCSILNVMLEDKTLNEVLDDFQKERKPNADAIRELALRNFIEMRDLVGDPDFLLRKKIESRLHELYPDQWLPLYSMVTFSHMPYDEALQIGKIHDRIMEDVMAQPDIHENWENLDFGAIVSRLKD